MNFAARELREYPAGKVCRLLRISRSTLYHRRKYGEPHSRYTPEEKQAVCAMFTEHHGSFGRRMLKPLLEKENIRMSERKISAIMKECGLRSKYGRKKIKNVYTSEETEQLIRENLFNRLTDRERKEMEIWSMDFTEQKIHGKKIYTCGIISVNRKILVGYSQSKTCNSALAITALKNAFAEYGKPDMVMTDRGSQFTSRAFHDMIEALRILHSMSRPHTPVDNRFIETFWKSMKVEMGKLDLLTEQSYRMVVDYYVYYYNNLRPHSSLNYRPPLAA